MKAKWFETQGEEAFLWTDAKAPSPTRGPLIYKPVPLSGTQLLPPYPLFLALFLSPSLPQIAPSNTEESWQNGRKHAQAGQGRIWCQQPRTIKGVKVLPSLNCSRSVKWEPKLFTSFSEQNCLRALGCTPHTGKPLRGSDKGQAEKSRHGTTFLTPIFKTPEEKKNPFQL